MDNNKNISSTKISIDARKERLNHYVCIMENEKDDLISTLEDFINVHNKTWHFCSRKGAEINLKKSIERLIDWQHEALILKDSINKG